MSKASIPCSSSTYLRFWRKFELIWAWLTEFAGEMCSTAKMHAQLAQLIEAGVPNESMKGVPKESSLTVFAEHLQQLSPSSGVFSSCVARYFLLLPFLRKPAGTTVGCSRASVLRGVGEWRIDGYQSDWA